MKFSRNMSARPLIMIICVLIVALISVGCSDSSVSSGTQINPLVAYQPSSATSGNPTDGNTKGVGTLNSPIVSIPQDDGRRDHTNAPLLDNWHPGWQQSDCFSCHTDQSRIPDHSYANTNLCYLCHGTNGLPGFGDGTPPIINGIVTTPTVNSVTVTWNTDKPCISRLIIKTQEGDRLEFPVSTDYLQSHRYVVNGLLSGTTYNFEIKATDRNFNVTSTSSIGVLCFTTLSVTTGTTTGPATTGPMFTNFIVEADSEFAIRVAFATREPVNATLKIVDMAAGELDKFDFENTTGVDDVYDGLTANTLYRVWVEATDADGKSYETSKKEVTTDQID